MSTTNQRNIELEKEIVALLQANDKRAISLLYKNYSGALFGIISRSISSKEVAAEVLQDVFVKVWKNSQSYNKQKGRLFTWLAQITRHATIDTLRSGKFQRSLKTDTLDTVVSIDNNPALSESMNIADAGLSTLINNLDEKYRVLIDYIYFQGYTHSEVSKELDIPLGTVKTRIRAAILELRKSLGNEMFTGTVLLLKIIEILEIQLQNMS